MFQSRLSLSAALLAVAILLPAQAKLFAAEEAPNIVPDPEIQKQIQAFSEAMLNAGKAEDGLVKMFQSLNALDKTDKKQLIEQLKKSLRRDPP